MLTGFWGAANRSMDELVGLALLVSLASIAWRGGQLLVALRSSSRLPVFAHLPLSKEQVFGLQWGYFLRTSAWSIFDFTVLYGILADRAGYGWNSWLTGLGMAVAQWLVILSAATCFLAYVRNRKIFRVAGVFALLAVLLFFLPSSSSVTRPLAGLAAWVPPLGWILYSMGISPPQGILFEWWTALSFAAVLFLLPRARQRLRKDFVVPEFAVGTEVQRGAIESWRRSELDGSNPGAFSGITASIRRREFLRGFDWQRAAFVERAASCWLNARERATAEFLSGGDPRWSKRLILSGLIVAGVAVLMWIFPGIIGAVTPFIIFFIFLLPRVVYNAGWPGAAIRNVSGSNISICSAYPLGFRQIARATIKCNLSRMLMLAPFLAAAGCALLQASGSSLGTGTLLGSKIVVAVLAFAMLTPVALITSGTNDTSKGKIILMAVPWSAVCSVSCIFLYQARNWERLLVSGCVLIVICGAAVAIYGHAYDHNWFDLQSKPRETLSSRPQ